MTPPPSFHEDEADSSQAEEDDVGGFGDDGRIKFYDVPLEIGIRRVWIIVPAPKGGSTPVSTTFQYET